LNKLQTYHDQTGQEVQIPFPPRRIVSLVPSQTELLYDLGLETEVVGITKFCVHPTAWFRNKTRVGGTKNVKPELIASLQPDLIIANKEENVKEQVEAMRNHYSVWTSDITNLAQALDMIRALGEITDTATKADSIAQTIAGRFAALPTRSTRPRTAYLIWQKPYMAAGGDTFIHDMLTLAGFDNIFVGENRYPEITIEQLRSARCERLLLSSEPFPFKATHIAELQAALPDTAIALVDGEMFSWYGSRLLQAAGYFEGLF
jgi:ABC-type Fe3+-hydroxamate transport system substrate-binding protein